MKPVAIVFLIVFLLIIGMAAFLGNLLGGTELFNPTRSQQDAYIIGTRSAIEINATQANWSATQTPQVAQVQIYQTQVAQPVQITQTCLAVQAHSTEFAHQKTATVEAMKAKIAQQGFEATQSSMAGKKWIDGQIRIATQQALDIAKERDAARSQNDALLAAFNLAFQILLVILLVMIILLLTIREAPKLIYKAGETTRKASRTAR